MFFVMVSWRAIQHWLDMVKFWSNIVMYLPLNVNILMHILNIAWKTWFVILEKIVSTKHMCMVHWKTIQRQNCIPIVQVFPVCQQYYDYLISRQEMGELIKVSPNGSNCFIKFFQKVIHCQPVTMRPRRYCSQWVWNTEKYILVQMIVYSIEKSLKDCINILDVGYQDTK